MKLSKLLVLNFSFLVLGCSSIDISNFKSLQQYSTPDFYGKYYGSDTSILLTNVLLTISEEKSHILILNDVKGEVFISIEEDLLPITKEYFFGKRIHYLKGSKSIVYLDDDLNLCVVFMRNDNTNYEGNGLSKIEVKKISDSRYDEIYKQIQNEIIETNKFLNENFFYIEYWEIPISYKPYTKEILELREKYRKELDYYNKIEYMKIDDIKKLEDEIQWKCLQVIQKKYFK